MMNEQLVIFFKVLILTLSPRGGGGIIKLLKNAHNFDFQGTGVFCTPPSGYHQNWTIRTELKLEPEIQFWIAGNGYGFSN